MEHLVGFVIIGLSALFVSAALLWRWHTWSRDKPKAYFGRTGVIYQAGAEPWPDLAHALDAISLTMNESKSIPEPDNFWIEVVPYKGEVITDTVTTGYIVGTQNVSKPLNEQQAKDVIKVTGSFKHVSFLSPFTKRIPVLVVRQTRQGDSRLTDALSLGIGVERGAVKSALFHEYAHHLVSLWLYGDINAGHTRSDLALLEKAIKLATKGAA